LSSAFHNNFPDYQVSLNVQIPIRKPFGAGGQPARYSSPSAILEAQLQQMKNAALLDVRNTYILLIQDRAPSRCRQ